MRNTSQDENYVGERGHERKVHKTHWTMKEKVRLTTKKRPTHKWVEYAPGKYIRVKIERTDGEEE
jgi:hypothetical protein